jgi:hypothetical protein
MLSVTETEDYTNHQRLLGEIKDKLCGGNAAELARRIGKDPTYVNRLFYPKGKAGAKGIGLEIMSACNRAFHLPVGFWDVHAPALDERGVERIRALMRMGDTEARKPWDPGYNPATDHVSYEENLRRNWASAGVDWPTGAPLSVNEPRRAFGMEPILAWEHPDDLPEGDFVMVPRLDVHLAAGEGREQVEIDLVKDNPQAFRTEWIRLMRLKPAKLAAMRAAGDSMEPTIHDGDSLLVDTSQATVVDGKVYALWYEGGERVKRLFRLPGGGLRIESDNQRFRALELPPGELEHVRIIGRVVHRSGTGGL